MTALPISGSLFKEKWIAFWQWALLIGFYCITCGFFVFPGNAGIQSSYYSLIVIPLFMLLPITRPQTLPWRSIGVFLLLPIYLATSHFWADPELSTRPKSSVFFFKVVLLLFLLAIAIQFLLESREKLFEHWIKGIAWIGSLSAIIGLSHYFYINFEALSAGELIRFKGLAWGGDTNRIAMFYLTSVLANAYLITQLDGKLRHLSICSILPPLLCILLTQSKIPLAILFLVTGVFLISSMRHGNKLIGCFAVALGIAISAWLAFGTNTFSRVYSFFIRWELWQEAINQVGDRWLFGNGLNYRVDIVADNITFGQAHSFIFDTYRFGGLVSIALIFTQITYTFTQGLKFLKNHPSGIFLMVWFSSGVIAALVYSQQPLTRPSYTWFLYWIPMMSILLLSHFYSSARINSKDNVEAIKQI
ncbi:hypothetical protein [Marinibactrum halimedae]|uniref:hypothetical protein n=1 Tax=Marinibactrum halimedae TaxID=1444977 RepID=UPI001E4BD779|nr:hypothetical protein [Marinibactrum halimedae]MCD9460466.1 hypothetical protein [Marinibactrum halimedae]